MTHLLTCAAFGVALRLAVSWTCADAGVFADMEQYQARAVHLAAEGALYPDALRGPGYPAVLALAYRLSGDSLWTARTVNSVLGGVLVLLTGVLARAAGAGRRAWVASAIVAAYPALILSTVYVMPEGLYALLLTACLVVVRHRSAPHAAAAGALAGAAMLTRSVGLALVAAPAAVWLRAWWHDAVPGRTAARRLALFAGACALVLLPWLAFTTRVAGGPLLDATSGFNLLAGNNPRATGRLELDDEPWLRETYVAGAASAAEGNRRAIAAGVAWALEHPGAWVRLAGRKLGYLFGLEGREHAWVYGHAYFGPRSATTVTLWAAMLLVSFPLLCVGAAVGVARAQETTPALAAMGATIAATAALHVASFGESRFHLPLVPLLAVAASLPGGGPTSAAPSTVRRARAVAAALVLAALAVAWSGQWGELRASLERLRAPDGWASRPPY